MRALIGQLKVKEKAHALSSTQVSKLREKKMILRVEIVLFMLASSRP
jgi:hypothetical protein